MEGTLNERKAELEAEIKLASQYLEENINNAKLSDYVSLGAGSVPGFLSGIFDNPSKAISNGDMISRTILPTDNIIRKIFKYLSTIKRGYNIITDESPKR